MEDLPPELRARRQEIYEKVTNAGRARRRRRRAAIVSVAAVLVATPIAAVAYTGSRDGTHPRITLSPPTTADDVTATSETASVPTTRVETTTTSSVAAVQPTFPPATEHSTTSSVLVCRNSRDPACGPFRYDRPITNAPAQLVVVSVTPAKPKVGEKVVVTLRATDPDSQFYEDFIWCNGIGYDFGDASVHNGCAVDCVGPGYGPWDPPAPHPSDLTVTLDHTYEKAGSFTAKFESVAESCGARPSSASTSVTIVVAAATPTT